jgi:DNA-binding Lrp family transcriptional regulator
MAHQKLDRLDRQILKLISDDARIPFLEVARACNVSGAAIHQRIQKLIATGILKGSQFIIDPEKIGYETCAFIGLNLKNPEQFDEVVKSLQSIPEVAVILSGMSTMDQIIENVETFREHNPVSEPEKALLAEVAMVVHQLACSATC